MTRKPEGVLVTRDDEMRFSPDDREQMELG